MVEHQRKPDHSTKVKHAAEEEITGRRVAKVLSEQRTAAVVAAVEVGSAEDDSGTARRAGPVAAPVGDTRMAPKDTLRRHFCCQ